ncbi:MAG: TetR/AcrR family transcriptional regulator [Myxococcales bacterium]|nr:TetR/AcrR family transcriptional regulator [Myxococcales bacterium]
MSPTPASRRPRVVKAADERRTEILDVAEHLFYERGYARTPIRAIIDRIGIAKGTFYHHFPSKTELLDALVQRIGERALAIAIPALNEPNLGAAAKFAAIFSNVGSWKLDNKQLFLRLMRALYSEENTPLRLKSQRASLRLFSPIVEQVIAEGIDEGVFRCTNPDIVTGILFTVATDLGEQIVRPLVDDTPVDAAELRRQLDTYNDTINRLLGADEGTIELYRWDLIAPWYDLEP